MATGLVHVRPLTRGFCAWVLHEPLVLLTRVNAEALAKERNTGEPDSAVPWKALPYGLTLKCVLGIYRAWPATEELKEYP